MAGLEGRDLNSLVATIEALRDTISDEEFLKLKTEVTKGLQSQAMIDEARRAENGEALAVARFLYSDILRSLSARVAAIEKAAH